MPNCERADAMGCAAIWCWTSQIAPDAQLISQATFEIIVMLYSSTTAGKLSFVWSAAVGQKCSAHLKAARGFSSFAAYHEEDGYLDAIALGMCCLAQCHLVVCLTT